MDLKIAELTVKLAAARVAASAAWDARVSDEEPALIEFNDNIDMKFAGTLDQAQAALD